MDTTRLAILCLIILVVVGFNAVLLLASRRKAFYRELEMYRTIAQHARNPFQRQDEDLQELSRLVSQLKANQAAEDSQADSETSDR